MRSEKSELGSRHRKALQALRSECSYDRVNFFRIQQLVTDVGEGTIADLETMGLIAAGFHSVTGQPGHRITPEGEAALDQPKTPKARGPRVKPLRKLEPAGRRLGEHGHRLK